MPKKPLSGPTPTPVVANILFYNTPAGRARVDVRFEDETFWLSQKGMAAVFDADVRTVNEHLQSIYASNELSLEATIRNFRIVQTEGSREVSRDIAHHNLDAFAQTLQR
jgi:hypothetical protein